VHGVPEHPFDDIEASLKKSVAAFREANVPALQALEDAGMKAERPPEAWLFKAWDGEVLVDVIFEPRGLVVDDELMARAEEREVMAIGIRLMALEDVLVSKLMSLDEHSADYSQILLMTRTLRERIDWRDLRARTSASPFAKAFFTLAEELGIAPRADSGAAAGGTPARARVRVVEGG
jgi:hypothetical protein